MGEQLKNILYADDDRDDQEIFQHVIDDIGLDCKVLFVDNGTELLHVLESRRRIPQLLFLDLNMPAKDGYQVLKEIKDVEMNEIRVVVFSTADDPEAIERTRSLGANLYLTKPGSYAKLKQAIRGILAIDWATFNAGENNFVFRA